MFFPTKIEGQLYSRPGILWRIFWEKQVSEIVPFKRYQVSLAFTFELLLLTIRLKKLLFPEEDSPSPGLLLAIFTEFGPSSVQAHLWQQFSTPSFGHFHLIHFTSLHTNITFLHPAVISVVIRLTNFATFNPFSLCIYPLIFFSNLRGHT